MRSFVFVVKNKRRDKYGNSRNTLSVYETTNSNLEPWCVVADHRIGSASEDQAVITALVNAGHIKMPDNMKFIHFCDLRRMGIANICRIE